VLGPYGAVFVAMTFAMRVPEASSVFVRFTRRKRIRN